MKSLIRAFFFLGFVTACGGSQADGAAADAGTKPSSPFQPGHSESDAGSNQAGTNDACAPGATVKTVLGQWDVMTTSKSGKVVHANLTLGQTSFVFEQGGTEHRFTADGANMSYRVTDAAGARTVVAGRTAPTTLDAGLVPFALGGDWVLTGAGGDGCNGKVRAESFDATCTQVDPKPIGLRDGSVVGKRVDVRPSVFGDLGGVWRFDVVGVDGAVDARLEVTLASNEITLKKTGVIDKLPTDVHLVLCEKRLSGTGTNGLEISGLRLAP